MTKWLGRDSQHRVIDIDPSDTDDTELIGVIAGGGSPVGLSAQPGTIYRRTNGTVWVKYGAGNDDWVELVTAD